MQKIDLKKKVKEIQEKEKLGRNTAKNIGEKSDRKMSKIAQSKRVIKSYVSLLVECLILPVKV